MMLPPLRSLQATLIVRLILFYSLVMVTVFLGLLYRASETAQSLADRDIGKRASDLVSFLKDAGEGKLELVLPSDLASSYSATTRIYLFAIQDEGGRVLFSSHPEIANLVKDWPLPGEDPDYFVLEDFGPDKAEYYGLVEEVDTPLGRFNIMVAQARDLNDLIEAIIAEFISDIAWALPLTVVATIGVCVWTIRLGMRTLVEVSDSARRLSPRTIDARLQADNIPIEVKPLVDAMNEALDRLQAGFEAQGRFAANAAHELRTPLAILRAQLEQSKDGIDRESVRRDLDRMSRVVEQLLQLARIEAAPPPVLQCLDLVEITTEVIANLAPYAISNLREVSLNAEAASVHILAEPEPVAAAIRNLVENALKFTPEGQAVDVTVSADGSVWVRDYGPGVPAEHHQKVFRPFWKGTRTNSEGAGLGLVIVAETASRFGGSVRIEDTEGVGAIFVLSFPIIEDDASRR